jgi:S-DNA-T family DNA segregation ATPase FtsK/SpoIIIE
MQGAFVSEEEVERVVEYVKTLGGPDYIDDEIFYDEEDESPAVFSEGEDPLYEKALEVVAQQGKASASYIQRRLKIGYNRAARLVEEMEHNGVVGPAQGSKPRELLRGV